MSAAFRRFDPNNGIPATHGAELHGVYESDEEQEEQLEPEPPPHSEVTAACDNERAMRFDNDDVWDVFIADVDELDPRPEPGDFWIEPDE